MRYLPFVVIAGLVLAAAATSAVAQQTPGGAPATPSQDRSWAKVCDTPAAPGVKTCVIHHEQVDRTSGAPVVAAGVWQTGKRETFTVVVPANVNQAAGTKVDILPSGLWEKVLLRAPLQKHEIARVRTLKLPFSSCDAEQCTAEIDAFPALIGGLKASAGFTVMVIRNGRAFAVPIALSGFSAAYDGPPLDSALYLKARSSLLRQLRERQKRPEPAPKRRGGDQTI
jgi:invasion protein IalB